MKLNMPSPLSPGSRDSGPDSNDSHATIKQNLYLQPAVSPPVTTTPPPMFSILVVAPLRYSRQATVQHIEKTLPSNVPHQITSRDNLEDCEKMLSGEDPVVFSHVVLVLKDVDEIIALTDRILKTLAHSSTTIVIITDLAQKRKIIEQAQEQSHKSLESESRVLFVFKPLKPSRFAIIFDPQKGREMSTDRNSGGAVGETTSCRRGSDGGKGVQRRDDGGMFSSSPPPLSICTEIFRGEDTQSSGSLKKSSGI